MTRILLVEDEVSFSDPLAYLLTKEGYDVAVAATGPDALTQFDADGADLVLLDLMLPGLSGVDVCRALRQRSNVPVIMLTAKDSEIDKVVGLELGADDYVTKPFSARELVLRVQSILRRSATASARTSESDLLTDGDLAVDPRARTASRGGIPLALTTRELDLLVHLLRHPGEAFSRTQLLRQVWGWEYGDESTVTVHVRRLREKVEPDPAAPQRIATVWGVGYRWDAHPAAPAAVPAAVPADGPSMP